jgi:hypothetical protein
VAGFIRDFSFVIRRDVNYVLAEAWTEAVSKDA